MKRGFRSCWIRDHQRQRPLHQRRHRQMAARMATRIRTSTVTRKKVTENWFLQLSSYALCSWMLKRRFDHSSEIIAPAPILVLEPEQEVEPEPIPVVERPIRSRGKTPVTTRTRSAQHNKVRIFLCGYYLLAGKCLHTIFTLIGLNYEFIGSDFT